MTVSEQKSRLRQIYIARSRALPPQQREIDDAALCAAAIALPEFQNAKTVFIYCGVDWEINTRPILAAALAAGKNLCLPICRDGGRMDAGQIFSLGELQPGKFGIPRPADNAPLISPDKIDLAFFPCVSCCRDGRRLGRGGGYYDRFSESYGGPAVILCRENMLADFLPVQPHDKSAGIVVSESAIYRPL